MAQPYVGEIRIFAGSFAPAGWMFCDGASLPISENETLFQLIGTTYGGDGQSTFNLPDLRGRLPVHQSQDGQYPMAQMAGQESVTLTTQQIPNHTHPYIATTTVGNQVNAGGRLSANSPNVKMYLNDPPDGSFNPAAIAPVGGSQPHENMHPFLALSFIISLFGIFPQPT